MSDRIKLNEGNIDVCEREVIALREIIAAAMGRLHQMRKQCERGYTSSEDFENALDAYGVIRERVDELISLVSSSDGPQSPMRGSMSTSDSNGSRTTALHVSAVSILLADVSARLGINVGEQSVIGVDHGLHSSCRRLRFVLR